MEPHQQTLDRLVNLATRDQTLGNLAAAERGCQEALALDPGWTPAKLLLGIVLAQRGDLARATEVLAEVLTAEPKSFEALIAQATIFLKTGRPSEATDLMFRAVAIHPNAVQARAQLGACLVASRRFDEAIATYRKVLQLDPSISGAHYNIGRIHQLEGRFGDAALAYGAAVKASPTFARQLAHGKALLTLCDFEGAESAGRACLDLNAKAASAHVLLCGALAGLQRSDEAEVHLRRAMDLDENGREAYAIAVLQRNFGLVDEANANLRRALEREPGSVGPYKNLFYSGRVVEADRPLVDRLRHILKTPGLGAGEAMAAHYGLGKALEDLGDYEESMAHYDEANRLARATKLGPTPLDRERYRDAVDKLLAVPTHDPDGGAPANPSDLPICILGMMRSGTTLAEQILSAHPLVQAAGEQGFWIRNAPTALAQGPACYPRLAEEYVRTLQAIGRQAPHVTDKMPGNYRFVGLIHAALPNVRILHMRRSPIDTCLSIWATTNDFPNEGGHDKSDIVFVYREYLRMMEHWRRVMPADRFLEVDYEDLVADGEPVIRMILTFCGLEWDDACLHPEANARPVSTPSAWQVRQPVYQTSVGRWRRFEPWLGPFRDLLDLN